MILKTYKPSQNLAAQIESYIYFKDYSPDHSIERAIPDGKMYLIFEFDSNTRTIYDNETNTPLKDVSKAWIAGMKSRYTQFSTHPDMEMMVAVFLPYGLFPFIAKSMDVFTNEITQAEKIWGSQIESIRAEIMQENSMDGKIKLFEVWLTSNKNENLIPQYLISEAILDIQNNSTLSLKEHVERSRYSKKQFIHLFKKYTGVTPKLYQRIIRFNEILQRIESGKMISWTQISGDCGYFDQAHFVKDFKAFSGLNPSNFLEIHEKTSRINFFPFD